MGFGGLCGCDAFCVVIVGESSEVPVEDAAVEAIDVVEEAYIPGDGGVKLT